MLTICWAAKGGSGTTAVAATRALHRERSLLIDLAGDAALVLGVAESGAPGMTEWLASEASASRLEALEVPVTDRLGLVPAGARAPAAPVASTRWDELAAHLAHERRDVVVDAGTSVPAAPLLVAADHAWLVTRPCYISLRAAAAQPVRPTGIVLVDEPGRALSARDIEASIGAPIVATVLLDPAIARAVDSGLLVARVPGAFRRAIEEAA